MIHYALIGIMLGISSSITPGPLLALVLSETLRRGTRAGITVALAPLVADIPLVVITIVLFSFLTRIHSLLGIVSLLGGAVLLYLGISNFRVRRLELDTGKAEVHAFTRGFAVNLLNPYVYLFWFTVGGPLAHRALEAARWGGLAAFLTGFFGSLVGTKILVAVIVGRTRHFIGDRLYRYIMWALGAGLCVLAVLFFRKGIGYFQ